MLTYGLQDLIEAYSYHPGLILSISQPRLFLPQNVSAICLDLPKESSTISEYYRDLFDTRDRKPSPFNCIFRKYFQYGFERHELSRYGSKSALASQALLIKLLIPMASSVIVPMRAIRDVIIERGSIDPLCCPFCSSPSLSADHKHLAGAAISLHFNVERETTSEAQRPYGAVSKTLLGFCSLETVHNGAY